jgi:hypothetical protein
LGPAGPAGNNTPALPLEPQRDSSLPSTCVARVSCPRRALASSPEPISQRPVSLRRDPSTSGARARGTLACGVGSHKRRAAGPFEALSQLTWRGRFPAVPGPISRLPGSGEGAGAFFLFAAFARHCQPNRLSVSRGWGCRFYGVGWFLKNVLGSDGVEWSAREIRERYFFSM